MPSQRHTPIRCQSQLRRKSLTLNVSISERNPSGRLSLHQFLNLEIVAAIAFVVLAPPDAQSVDSANSLDSQPAASPSLADHVAGLECWLRHEARLYSVTNAAPLSKTWHLDVRFQSLSRHEA